MADGRAKKRQKTENGRRRKRRDEKAKQIKTTIGKPAEANNKRTETSKIHTIFL